MVGTALYVSPEVQGNTKSTYNQVWLNRLNKKPAWNLRYYVQCRSLMLNNGEFEVEKDMVGLLR